MNLSRRRRAVGVRNLDRRQARLKWLAFGVLLPLLPIVARTLANVLQNRIDAINFGGLFGDGELLVIATVIAAAGIGDAIFSDRNRNTSPESRLRVSFAITGALFVVVLSVLVFGLVTLRAESRSDQILDASLSISQDQNLKILEADQYAARARYDSTMARAQFYEKRAAEEANGTGGTLVPGLGAEYRLLQSVAKEAQQEATQAEQDASQAQYQVQHRLSELQSGYAALLSAQSEGQVQVGVLAVTMFLLSLVVGYWCIVVTTPLVQPGAQDVAPISDNRSAGGIDAPTGVLDSQTDSGGLAEATNEATNSAGPSE